MSRIHEYSVLTPFGEKDGKEIFIGCASYEERCQGALLSVAPNYSLSAAILLYNKDYIKLGSGEKSLNEMREKVARLSYKEPAQLDFISDKPDLLVLKFEESLREALENSEKYVVTIDITTFPRHELFLILKAARKLIPASRLRILYSEPEGYSTERKGGWLTRGVQSVEPMFGFGGIQDPILRKLLVILPGHEGERTYITWRCHQPDKTLVISQGEPYHEGLNDIAERENSLLQTMLGDICLYGYRAPAREVDGVYLELERIYSRYAHKYNIVIAPMGTKMQTLGIYLFAESRPDVQITYAVPIEYNWRDYSWGVGKKWEIMELDPYASNR